MIRRAVVPAAGIGSRMLPLTKAMPKEMLPVGDRPVIEHTVRELIDSGVTDITVVVSGGKGLVHDHFRPDPVLVGRLRAEGHDDYADAVEEIGELSRSGHLTYLDQQGPYGNGTPVLNAARHLGDEPLLVLWPDDVFVAEVPRARQLVEAYDATGGPIVALMAMEPEESRRYGVPVVEEDLGDGLMRIAGLVEKPEPEDAPSSFAAVGGYVVTPQVIEELQAMTDRWYERPEGEIYLTDAFHTCAARHSVHGKVIHGRWYDTGNPSAYLTAQFAHALADPAYGPALRELARQSEHRQV